MDPMVPLFPNCAGNFNFSASSSAPTTPFHSSESNQSYEQEGDFWTGVSHLEPPLQSLSQAHSRSQMLPGSSGHGRREQLQIPQSPLPTTPYDTPVPLTFQLPWESVPSQQLPLIANDGSAPTPLLTTYYPNGPVFPVTEARLHPLEALYNTPLPTSVELPLMQAAVPGPLEPIDYSALGYFVPSTPMLVETPSHGEYPQPCIPEAVGAWADPWLDVPQPPNPTSGDNWPDYFRSLNSPNGPSMMGPDPAGIPEKEITDPTLIEALQSGEYIAFDLWLTRAASSIPRPREQEWDFERQPWV